MSAAPSLNSLIIVVVMGLVTLSTAAQGLLEKALVYFMMALTPDMRFISLVLCSRLPSRLSCS